MGPDAEAVKRTAQRKMERVEWTEWGRKKEDRREGAEKNG